MSEDTSDKPKELKDKYCLSCYKNLNDHDAYLTEYGPDVCIKCWKQVTPFKRIILSVLLYDGSCGGAFPASEILGMLKELLPKVFEACHGHHLYNECYDCDRASMVSRGEAKRQRAKAKELKRQNEEKANE